MMAKTVFSDKIRPLYVNPTCHVLMSRAELEECLEFHFYPHQGKSLLIIQGRLRQIKYKKHGPSTKLYRVWVVLPKGEVTWT